MSNLRKMVVSDLCLCVMLQKIVSYAMPAAEALPMDLRQPRSLASISSLSKTGQHLQRNLFGYLISSNFHIP